MRNKKKDIHGKKDLKKGIKFVKKWKVASSKKDYLNAGVEKFKNEIK